MNRFPLSVDLRDQTVFLIGDGPQIRDKAQKLLPFGPRLIQKNTFTPEDAGQQPALVIVGDTPLAQAEAISDLCRSRRIPVNVVDVPRLCSFYFPALIIKGSLTVSVCTGGSSPLAAARLRQQLLEALPENTEQLLDWLRLHRQTLRQRGLLREATAQAFALGRPLTGQELKELENRSAPREEKIPEKGVDTE